MSYQYPAGVTQQQTQIQQMPPKEFKGGFHPLYLLPIGCLTLTYGYIILFAVVTNYLRSLYGVKGNSDSESGGLPFLLVFFPFILTGINTLVTILCRKLDRRYFLGASLILKYGMIPFFVAGGLLIAIFFLLIFTPVVIMIFVSPPIIIVLSVIGWLTLTESMPFMIMYFVKAAKDGVFSRNKVKTAGNIVFAVFGCIMQMFFCLDVVAAVIAVFKEKRHVKLTIVILALPIVLFGVSMAILVAAGLIKG